MNSKVNDSIEFHSNLEKFDMTAESGLLFVKYKDEASNFERLILETAEKYRATAVYFRRFPNNERPPIPQIFIYDCTLIEKDSKEISELHKKLWNSAQVPLFFIFTKTEVKIFNCLKQPNFDTETGEVLYTVFEQIKLASQIKHEIEKRNEVFKEFSAKKFDNGSFWETSIYKDFFNLNDSVYEKLLSELKRAKKKITEQKILPTDIAQRLLVMTILIRYLEEREDEEGRTVFPVNFFSNFASNAKSFVEVLRKKGACLDLFDFLGSHFNGKIFELDKDEDRNWLLKADLNLFADFLDGKIDGVQYVLWPLYSFNHLPIELISNIYEDFLEKKSGVVYTPPYLVNFLIDECIPIEDVKANFKVLDPACGSGVFLVAAYRRIVNRWRALNNWQKPSLRTLKELIKENIYGVDISHEAIRLAIFSLSLALCDMLSPKVIWEELKFDNLYNVNLFCDDFFKLVREGNLDKKFDLVIGNPPFISKLTTDCAKKIEANKSDERPKLPDNQIALLFLEQAINLCKENALVCLIIPAGPFLYNSSSFDFRRYILDSYNVPQIIDFTALRKVLFESAEVSTLAVFVKKESPTLQDLLHITIRRTKPTKEKLYFEVDHYDFHRVPYQEALDSRFIWKSNLLGGGRLKHLINRLASQRILGEYLNEKVKNYSWYVGEGFRAGKKKEIEKLIYYKANKDVLTDIEIAEREELEEKYSKAEFLTGKPTLPTEALTEDGIDQSQIYILEEEYFLTKRAEQTFRGPHVLIKEVAGQKSIPIGFTQEYLTFGAQIIGIFAPTSQIGELKKIERRLKNNTTYLFFAAASSGRYMVSKYTSILKDDINNLPYPENEEEMELSETEKILVDDTLNFILPFHNKGENSIAVKDATKGDLAQFGELYCKLLNTIYKELRPHEPIETESFICYPFDFKDESSIKTDGENIEGFLNQLLVKNYEGSNLRIIRVLRIYDENVIYLVKPKQIRYWLRSVAIRDADETFIDLVKQGY
jgi:hypothetical protein